MLSTCDTAPNASNYFCISVRDYFEWLDLIKVCYLHVGLFDVFLHQGLAQYLPLPGVVCAIFAPPLPRQAIVIYSLWGIFPPAEKEKHTFKSNSRTEKCVGCHQCGAGTTSEGTIHHTQHEC